MGGALHIVPTTCAPGKLPQADTASLPADFSERIAAALKADRWCGHGGSHLLKIDDYYFLLSPISKFDTSTPQKGRQIGLDAAQRLADFRFEHVVICAAELDPLAIFDGMVMGLYDIKFNHTHTDCGDDEGRGDNFTEVRCRFCGEHLPHRSNAPTNCHRAILIFSHVARIHLQTG